MVSTSCSYVNPYIDNVKTRVYTRSSLKGGNVDSIQPIEATEVIDGRMTVHDPVTGEEVHLLPVCDRCGADRKLTYLVGAYTALCPDCLYARALSSEAGEDLERRVMPLVDQIISDWRARGLNDVNLLDVLTVDIGDIADLALRRAFGGDLDEIRHAHQARVKKEITGRPS